MTCDEEGHKEARKGASNFTLTISGVVSVIMLIASMASVYSSTSTRISNLEKGEQYQARTDDRQDAERKADRDENRAAFIIINEKLDRLLQERPGRH